MRSNLARVESLPSMARESSSAVQVTLRVPKELIPVADEVSELISRPGLRASRNDAFRAALARGLEVLRSEELAARERKSEPKPKKR